MQVGDRVGEYELRERVATCGVATLYRAEQARMEREVALYLHDHHSAVFHQSLRESGLAVARIPHPNIASIHDLGQHEGATYIVSPWVGGETMQEHLWRGRPTLSDIARELTQVCQALEHAHAHRITHGDVNPAAIVRGPARALLLTNFGVMTALERATPEGGVLPGLDLPEYVAPEHVRGRATPTEDVFAAGVLLYVLLTRQPPPRRAGDALPPIGPMNPLATPAIDLVLRRATAWDAAQRYRSPRELCDAFIGALNARTPAAPPAAPPYAMAPRLARAVPQPPAPHWSVPPAPSAPSPTFPSGTPPSSTITVGARRSLHPAVQNILLLGLALFTLVACAIIGTFAYQPLWQQLREATGHTSAQSTPSAASPAARATATAEAIDARRRLQSPTLTLVYQENFQHPSHSWPADTERVVKGGLLQLTDPWADSSEVQYLNQNIGDSFIDVNLQLLHGAPDATYGVSFREWDEYDFYTLWLSADGRYSFTSSVNTHWTTLIPWTPSAAIKPGTGAANAIRVEAVDNHFIFLINGVRLNAITNDAIYFPGDVGVVVGDRHETVGVRTIAIYQVR